MWLWESGVGDKSEEDDSDESERGVGEAAYLVWTAVSSVVEQVAGRLTAAALSDQQRERRGCLSLYMVLFGACLLCTPALVFCLYGLFLCSFSQR